MSEENETRGERDLADRKFYPADQEAAFSDAAMPQTPQTRHPAYKLAFRDTDFLLRDELRPVRFQLELLKPEMLLDEAGVGSTLVMYGSARIPPPEAVDEALAGAKDLPDDERRVVENLARKAKYYGEAYKLSKMVSEKSIIEGGKRQFVVCSGGGPSIMEAANKGASDAGAESIGLNIVLPHEQAPNPYVTPYLSFQFHYFALRKMHFLLRAKAVAVFPGGFGTFDEFFELLTLIQTGKMKPMPILLFGKDFWNRVIDFEALADEGTISHKDLELFRWCETADEAWEKIARFYQIDGYEADPVEELPPRTA
ncbi:LOG family protein [Pelagerythrobacter marinus]|uniref:AMP nucleosidase n=1 Tax=Pelagerythrobacter marinus TaxID=538382 RepID=A0ABW9V107_9SPHN|nr:LOG family protein [Pelagerythrobacter marinus]MEC9065703.1 LOG family protein [Pseudomonadota bacterium]MXO69620.1 lysine decarboxylase [Pelagerythrobacter marinus]USA39651.1 LOG family protein [Pelagerythrobacter marinus]WPZ06220.1 LOG family protein [Pelagerythrobacter marinus]